MSPNATEWEQYLLRKLDKIEDKVDELRADVAKLQVRGKMTSVLLGLAGGALPAIGFLLYKLAI